MKRVSPGEPIFVQGLIRGFLFYQAFSSAILSETMLKNLELLMAFDLCNIQLRATCVIAMQVGLVEATGS